MKKTIGIIGGMGPMATAELFRMIVLHTDSPNDQGHARILIDNNTQIPDRTEAILTGSKAPVEEIERSARGLVSLGADFLLIPCNTSHFFFDEIQRAVSVEIVHMIDETAKEIRRMGLTRVGLLATTGTVEGRLYHRSLEQQGIELIVPEPDEQQIVMDFIYSGVKASDFQYDTGALKNVIRKLSERGAQSLILGCTELPVGVRMFGLDFPYIDSLEVLAKAAVIKAGYRYK